LKLISRNPATGEINTEVECWSSSKCLQVVDDVTATVPLWRNTALSERINIISTAADALQSQRQELAALITLEMGKVITESIAEIDKCISACRFYSENAHDFLRDEEINSDASRSFVTYQPLGTILGIMPWNFPFWQVFRFAIPALLTGNTIVLKHSSNVPLSALAAEKLLHTAGVPRDVFRCLMIHSSQLEPLYSDSRIQGVALTGSEQSGRLVAQKSSQSFKKLVLELGGSDAFIVLEDADIEVAVKVAVASRFFTSGQSCINAKRFILVASIADKFMSLLQNAVNEFVLGDPTDTLTKIGPMARHDLRETLQRQIDTSVQMGAKLILGGHAVPGPGYYFQPSILVNVKKGMPAYDEEIFGPVISVIEAIDEQEAIFVANDTKYGLGGSVWTRNVQRGENVARQIESGTVYVNGMVKSDPRLPFGGIKNSGMGRELGRHGMLEFTNVKTIWIA